MNYTAQLKFHRSDSYEDAFFECDIEKVSSPLGRFFVDTGENPKKSYLIKTKNFDDPFSELEIYPQDVEMFDTFITVTGFRVIYKRDSPPILLPIIAYFYPKLIDQRP